jgi:hypothetical protein
LTDLVNDIYAVLSDGVDITQEQADQFGQRIADMIKQRLQKETEPKPFTLRMSNLGKGDRQLWYDKQYGREEQLPPATLFKFVYGDLIEHLVLFLAELAGHSVTNLQDEVLLKGIKGHIDAEIDGVTVDVKSASTHSFRKFQDGSLVENDPFGYIEQLAGYTKARGTDGAFLAVDKQNGHITYLPFTKAELDVFDIESRIDHIKAILDDDTTPPERCYEDIEDGKSGNRILGVNCSYCPHKSRCWADSNDGLGLRTFLYASGPKFFTQVSKEPNVREVTF